MVAEKGASGDFDYLREETDGSDGVDVVDEDVTRMPTRPTPTSTICWPRDESRQHDGFDAFDENNWDRSLHPGVDDAVVPVAAGARPC